MQLDDCHLSDQDLLLAADGELSPPDQARVASHLAACRACRTRKHDLETAVGDFTRGYRRSLGARVPSADGPRALLKAQIAQLHETSRYSSLAWLPGIVRKLPWPLAAGLCLALLAGYSASRSWIAPQRVRAAMVTMPNRVLTPGATVFLGSEEVCRASNTKNRNVPTAIRRKVFEEYGIPSAQPHAYEVDYLITPALGGSDDIHNLWPESNSATVWNSLVKDALEDYLRDLVCAGQIDLATAQREIALNWIEAYKKYFHTDRPLQTAKRR
jgi:hypothetical protein